MRREYAAWYPTISVSVWIPAVTVARAVARQLLEPDPPSALGPRWDPGPRILDDRHFEFRGGVGDRAPSSRTRREDDGPPSDPTHRTRHPRGGESRSAEDDLGA